MVRIVIPFHFSINKKIHQHFQIPRRIRAFKTKKQRNDSYPMLVVEVYKADHETNAMDSGAWSASSTHIQQ